MGVGWGCAGFFRVIGSVSGGLLTGFWMIKVDDLAGAALHGGLWHSWKKGCGRFWCWGGRMILKVLGGRVGVLKVFKSLADSIGTILRGPVLHVGIKENSSCTVKMLIN